MSEATIRQALAADLAALTALRTAAARERASERGDPGFDDPGFDDPGFEDRLAAWLARESSRRIIFLAEVSGRPVGFMNLTFFERMPQPGRPSSGWGYLGNAFVLPGRRDQGIGGQLLAAVLGHARERGLVRVVLSPSQRSIPFYQRAGFGPADELLVWRP